MSELTKKRLLIMDDESDLIQSYQTILTPKSEGPRVASSRKSAANKSGSFGLEKIELVCVQSGEEAVKAAQLAINEGNRFVGGFFDVRLGPGIDGIETVRRIRELDPEIQCVLVTAYQDRNLSDISAIFGEDCADKWDYLCKPFSAAEIMQKAVNLVSNWSRRQREKQYVQHLEHRQEQEEVVRSLVKDLFKKIRLESSSGAAANDVANLKATLGRIEALTDRADGILEKVLSAVKIDKAA